MEEVQVVHDPPQSKQQPELPPLKITLERICTNEKNHGELIKLAKGLDQNKKLNIKDLTSTTTRLLTKIAPSLDDCVETLVRLSRALLEADARYALGRSIFAGFEDHWKKQEIGLSAVDKMWAVDRYDLMNTAFLEGYLQFFYTKEYVDSNSNRLQDEVWKLFRDSQSVRALKLMRGFGLLPLLDRKRLVNVVANLELSYPKDIDFIFVGNRPLQELYAKRLYRNDFKACADFVHRHGLNPHDYPGMLWNLEKGWMNYCIRTFSLDLLQLKFMHDPRYLSYLALRNFTKNKSFAESLLMKYNLYENDVFVREAYEQRVRDTFQRRNGDTILSNHLIANDCFGATESRVLGETQDYLELAHLSMSEADVLLVDRLDSKFLEARVALSNASTIGLDCQFTSGYTKFHKPYTLNLIQLSTYEKVFLLDAQALAGAEQFKELLNYVFFEHPSNTIVGFSAGEDLRLVRQCIGDKKGLQCPRFVDIQKAVGGGSLKKCVETHFSNKKFSKFEQCSAWNVRPFRRTQLHYAALDARVLLELYDAVKAQPAAFTKILESNQRSAEETTKNPDAYEADNENGDCHDKASHPIQEPETEEESKFEQPATTTTIENSAYQQKQFVEPKQITQVHLSAEPSQSKQQTASSTKESKPIYVPKAVLPPYQTKVVYVPKEEYMKNQGPTKKQLQDPITSQNVRARPAQNNDHRKKNNPYRQKAEEVKSREEIPTKKAEGKPHRPKYKLKEENPAAQCKVKQLN